MRTDVQEPINRVSLWESDPWENDRDPIGVERIDEFGSTRNTKRLNMRPTGSDVQQQRTQQGKNLHLLLPHADS
jgi:hypothetical protein